ncbi:MAG: hypothetical protein Q9162_001657 [Coniocarpon cinnabarinum]
MATSGHDVAAAVSNIIVAFYSFRDTLARIGKSNLSGRAKRSKTVGPKQNGRKVAPKPLAHQIGPQRLEASISKAPTTIQNEYAAGVSKHGDRFQAGDDQSLARLAATLVQLNTGLVEIIGSFLERSDNSTNNSRKRNGSEKPRSRHSPCYINGSIDYTRLAILSDASRIETCETLTQLGQRLSRQHDFIAPSPTSARNTRSKPPNRRDRSSPTKHSKPVHYAFVRTKPKPESRRGSSSTASSTRPQVVSGSGSSDPSEQIDGHSSGNQNRKALVQSSSPALSGTTVALSPEPTPLHFDDGSWPKVAAYSPMAPTFACNLQHPTKETPFATFQAATPALRAGPPRPHLEPAASAPIIPCRQVSTSARSQRTMATSASTQIGEIPMHRWAATSDLDRPSTMNAGNSPWESGAAQFARLKENITKTPRRGFFAKVFRRTPVAEVNT